jgi:ferrochelatase
VAATVTALEELPATVREEARLVFVTHSVPLAMAAKSGPDGDRYPAQHIEAAGLVAAEVAGRTGVSLGWDLVFCSRSGPPEVPWLEPDVNDHLEKLDRDGGLAAVLVPIGFVSDHMEVVYDLDTEARASARRLGLALARAATPGTHPAFVSMIGDLVLERAAVERGQAVQRPALGPSGASWDLCPTGCCANPRADRPALAEPGCLRPAT